MFEKTLKEISDDCKKIDQKVSQDFHEISPMLNDITEDYRYHKEKPGASDIYLKISRDIIDKEVNKYIQYEKKLISYNDYIINIKNDLNN